VDWARAERELSAQFLAPDVLVPLLAWESGAVAAEAALDQAVPQLLSALAAPRSSRSGALLWDLPISVISVVAQDRLFRFEPPAEGAVLAAEGLELRLHDGTLFRPTTLELDSPLASRPFFAVDPALPLRLSTFDSNPLASIEAHPDKQGNAVSLGGKTPEEWCRALRDALELVRAALTQLFEEIARTLKRVVPVGYEPEIHCSASYREAPGLVYLTLHPDPVTLAEALIHETQHGKLNALSFFDPVLHNGQTEWAPSPVRPDLRPLMGVLLAAHAFVPVAEFHRRLAEIGHELSRTEAFARRRAEVLASNANGLAVLEEKARASELGATVLRELRELHEHCRRA
jgi:HEXXH motif-containing protein